MSSILIEALKTQLASHVDAISDNDIPTLDVSSEKLLFVCKTLRDAAAFQFDMLIDVCGVDYADYGMSYWRTNETTETGFNRGVEEEGQRVMAWEKSRFASVYHLLSVARNQRVRLKVYLDESLVVPSVIDIWKSADWFERESYDLFGIIYEGHPDLRRILTDYGFKGHPFRKDFPLIGEVEMHYDAKEKRCVYAPVSIEPRTLVPKVIRKDNRYVKE